MKRTWKDAACEVAWNYINSKGNWFINISQFLKGQKSTIHHLNECNCITIQYWDQLTSSMIKINMNYNIFKQLFMKWLNERGRIYGN